MKRVEGGRDLTRESLDALLDSLDPDREKAGVRYEEIRRRLIRFFEWRGCAAPEELADETINRVARQLAAGLTLHADPYAYFCGVARLVTLEELRRGAREQKARDAQAWISGEIGEPEDDSDPRLDHLRHCLQILAADQQTLILRYHQGEAQGETRIQDRKRLCRELGIEMNALRIRVHRLRRKIETCIQERLK